DTDCRVEDSSSGARVVGADSYTTVRDRIVPATRIDQAVVNTVVVKPTPDDQLAACPDARVSGSTGRRVSGAGGRPTIRAGIISPTGVKTPQRPISTAPDDHFAASPHCRVTASGSGARVGNAGGCPTIRDRIISPAGVKRGIERRIWSSTPDDHSTAGPHRP